MGHLIIQNLDDAVLDSLRTRAAGLHKSVEETAAEILGEACGAPKMLTPAERYQLILKIRSEMPSHPGKSFPTAEAMIREDRDCR